MLKVKKSKIGYGLFSLKPIEANQIICEIKGEKVHYLNLLKIGGKTLDNAFRYSTNYYISPGKNFGNYLNHSCLPNARIAKKDYKLYLISIEKIAKNSEILFDYSTILAKDDIWTMPCKCGNKNCRKVIKNYTKLNKELLNKYIKHKILPGYIAKL